MSNRYPLCSKYKAPLTEGDVCPYKPLQEWVKTLPANWPERFSDVCGPVTATEQGMYACDVEDTLYALERNLSCRRWNG